MSLFIKICGLRGPADVDAALAAGADAIGFVFAPSPRRVTPSEARAAAEGAPEGVRRVAVMLHPSNDEWLEVLDGFAPDVLQTDAADFASLTIPPDLERWPVYREGGAQAPGAGTFVYEGPISGRGATVDWQRAREHAVRGRMILAGGLAAHSVAEAVRVVRPFGVDVSSGVESAPGRKDPEKIAQFIRAARAAETET